MSFVYPDDRNRTIEQGMLVIASPVFCVDILAHKAFADSLIEDKVENVQLHF